MTDVCSTNSRSPPALRTGPHTAYRYHFPFLLTTPLTFGLLWLDLARVAGEEPPADVAALAEVPIVAAVAD